MPPARRRGAQRDPRPSKPRAARAEVVVIGAGAVGSACASALARAGKPVRVLTVPGRSTTSVSGGHLLLQSKRPGPVLELARRSMELLAEFATGQEQALQYRRTGSLLLAVTEEEAAALRAHHAALTASGVPLQWLEPDAARELEPHLGPSLRAAAYCPTDAQVHPALLAGAWLQDALAHGAAVTSGVQVQGFVTSGGAVCGVLAGGVEYPAEAVVLAAGVWSGEIARLAGVETGIRPRRGLLLRAQVDTPLVSRPVLGASYLQAKFSDAPCEVAFSLQQHPDGECVLGGTREFAEFSPEITDKCVRQVIGCSARYLPVLAEVTWSQHDLGYRPWTPDGLPRIGPSSVPGLLLACGHEGDGVTLAAVTAERIAVALA